MNISYIDILSKKYPTIEVSCFGSPFIYENILWGKGPAIPDQATLDSDIVVRIKDKMWDLIKDERDRRTQTGGYKVGTDWYHSDTSSRIQQLGLVMMGAGLPPDLYWKTMSGGFVLMTQTLAGQIFQAAAASDMTIFTIAEQKKAAMLASANPENYDHLSGWPLIYGE